ncbi:MAG: MarR family transcriptional regulator [Clostridia bacterium]|nr:MarR family transcriptional regulator [Clostridia bacterium]
MNTIRISFRRINRWAQGFVARRTRDTGLTPSQIQALRHIGYHKVMSQQELVEDMGVDKAAVTRLVAGLEERGYVIRSADPKDGRAKVLQATEAALQVKDDVIALEEAYYDWLLEGLEPEMRENFTRAMDLLLQRAKEGRRSCYCEIDAQREKDGDGSCT